MIKWNLTFKGNAFYYTLSLLLVAFPPYSRAEKEQYFSKITAVKIKMTTMPLKLWSFLSMYLRYCTNISNILVNV